MRHFKGLIIGISVLALMGCAVQQQGTSGNAMPEAEAMVPMEGMPALVNQIGEDFYLFHHDGRCYVVGSAEMARKFEGGGPQGKTVVFEVDKKKPEYVERLMAQFQSRSI